MNKSLSVVAALAAVVLAGSALAYSPKNSAAHAASVASLVPTKVVNPTALPRSFMRSTVHIEFSLDQAGQPQDIKVLSSADQALKVKVVQAFSQWRFESAPAEQRAHGKRFILPLEIVPGV